MAKHGIRQRSRSAIWRRSSQAHEMARQRRSKAKSVKRQQRQAESQRREKYQRGNGSIGNVSNGSININMAYGAASKNRSIMAKKMANGQQQPSAIGESESVKSAKAENVAASIVIRRK